MRKLFLAGLCFASLLGASQAARADDLVAAVLPSSRSGVVGEPVTVFATMINTSGGDAAGCAVATSQSGLTLSYQPTDPATNRPVGTPNTPVSIANGAAQSFVLTFVASAAMQAVDVPLTFDCTGLQPAAVISGLDTLLLTMDGSTEPPDIVALAATIGGTGLLSTTGGAAAFSVASIDVGAGAAITVTPTLGDLTGLPVTLAICQTDATGACLATPAAAVQTTYATGGTATFAVFATITGTIPDAPAWARVFVVFTDGGGVVRGKTSVALGTNATSQPSANPGGVYEGEWRITSSSDSVDHEPQRIAAMVSETGEFHLLPASFGGFGAGDFAAPAATPAHDHGQTLPILRETLALTADAQLGITGSGTAYAAGTGPTAATGTVTVTGLYSPQHVLILNYTNGTEQGTFNLNYVRPLYDQPTSLAAVTGTFNLRDESNPQAAQGSITVAADGSFTGTGTTGCAETGNLTVLDAQHSLFQITMNQAACAGADAASFTGLSLFQSQFQRDPTMIAELSNPTTAVMNSLSTH